VILGLELAKIVQKRLGNFHPSYLQFNLDNLLVWLLVPGIIGARTYHVIDYWDYYSEIPIEILKIWQGGLGIYGGIAGGLIGLLIYRQIHKQGIRLLPTLDVIVFALLIAQEIGRLGNFFNQELFGLPTTLPWGIWIDPENRLPGFEQFTRFHPLFAYEAIANILLLGLMWKLIGQKRKLGYFFSLYLIGYGLIRFCLDFLRLDPWRVGWLTVAQWISLGIAVVGMRTLILKRE